MSALIDYVLRTKRFTAQEFIESEYNEGYKPEAFKDIDQQAVFPCGTVAERRLSTGMWYTAKLLKIPTFDELVIHLFTDYQAKRSQDPRNATAAEIKHLTGLTPGFGRATEIAAALDALNLGITYNLRRHPGGTPFDINVDYLSLPQVYRDDMAAIGVTLPHLI